MVKMEMVITVMDLVVSKVAGRYVRCENDVNLVVRIVVGGLVVMVIRVGKDGEKGIQVYSDKLI